MRIELATSIVWPQWLYWESESHAGREAVVLSRASRADRREQNRQEKNVWNNSELSPPTDFLSRALAKAEEELRIEVARVAEKEHQLLLADLVMKLISEEHCALCGDDRTCDVHQRRNRYLLERER